MSYMRKNDKAVIRKKPLDVLSLKDSTTLIKGKIYQAVEIRTHSYNYNKQTITSRTISILGHSYYVLSRFAYPDGKPLTNEPDFQVPNLRISWYEEKEPERFKGQYVRCTHDSGKSLKKDEIYFVEDVVISYSSHQYGTTMKQTKQFKFKIRGITRQVDPGYFAEIEISEQRNLKLQNLAGTEIRTGIKTRKFLLYNEKEKIRIFYQLLTKSLQMLEKVDTKGVDIIDLIVRNGKNFAIQREDVEILMKMSIKDTLSLYKLKV